MIRFKDIHIPKPCSVDYNSLPGNEVTRFCASCKKQVYDFRGKDETYFNSIINTHGKVCGVFYKDEINNYSKITLKKYPKRILVKIISILFFIKSFLTIQNTKASSPEPTETVQFATNTDSTAIKTTYKGRPARTRVTINIYINNTFYKEVTFFHQQYIYLPDSIKPNDKIKIMVVKNDLYKSKTYTFKYSHANDITIAIVGKKPIRFFKRRHVIGAMGDFW